MPRLPLLFLFLPALAGMNLSAAVNLPAVFGDNMVLQQGKPVPVWGTAAEGEAVKVCLNGQPVASGVVGADGKWQVHLPPLPPGPVGDLVIEGGNRIVLKNVLAGEVWLCSGQSNMRMTVSKTSDCDYGGVLNEAQEVQDANYPEIRFFDGTWKPCSPESVRSAYALPYFFARNLHRELGVPVGLLEAAVGGSPAEAWVAPSVWDDELKHRAVEAYRPEYAVRMEDFRESLRNWEKTAEKGPAHPRKPHPPVSPVEYPGRFSALYRRLIQPLVPFAIRGVLWYQGESNAWRTETYPDLLTRLISGWRKEWPNPDLPFLIVQLANWGQTEKYLRTAGLWAEVRAMQAEVVRKTPHTGLVVTLDIGDTVNLHPPNKQEVGRRAALVARQTIYGKDILASGPVPSDAEWSAEGVCITFDHTGKGMTLGSPQGGFELAGGDGKFQPAHVRLDGRTVVVSAEGIGEPRIVRYAWKDNPEGLLHNSEGLPAAPFRIER